MWIWLLHGYWVAEKKRKDKESVFLFHTLMIYYVQKKKNCSLNYLHLQLRTDFTENLHVFIGVYLKQNPKKTNINNIFKMQEFML